jgi:hypothetical protein
MVLPMPPLPPDEKAYYDKFFYAKGTQLFTDEDLKMWLSTIRGMNMPVIYHCACARAASTSESTFSSCFYYYLHIFSLLFIFFVKDF